MVCQIYSVANRVHSTYGVGLLGFDADLLENNSLGVRRTTEGAIILSVPAAVRLQSVWLGRWRTWT